MLLEWRFFRVWVPFWWQWPSSAGELIPWSGPNTCFSGGCDFMAFHQLLPAAPSFPGPRLDASHHTSCQRLGLTFHRSPENHREQGFWLLRQTAWMKPGEEFCKTEWRRRKLANMICFMENMKHTVNILKRLKHEPSWVHHPTSITTSYLLVRLWIWPCPVCLCVCPVEFNLPSMWVLSIPISGRQE